MDFDGNEPKLNRRILVIDDNPAIHDDFRKILCRGSSAAEIEADEVALFGASNAPEGIAGFQVDVASQGQEGLEKVRAACAEGNPYSLAFVDIRMPPGWDGVETIGRIWKVCPELQIVICTAYSDYSWEEIFRKVGQNDSLLILKKPFDNVEVMQLAHAMTRKWTLNLQARQHVGQLNRLVHERTIQLRDANDGLTRTVRQLETATDRAGKKAREAEAANRAKDVLLNELATELRTSLPAINQLTDQLLSGHLDGAQRHQAEAIRLNCRALIEFAGRALHSREFEPAPADPAPVPFKIREVTDQLVALCASSEGGSKLAVTTEIDRSVPEKLTGDPLRLKHTLSEVVSVWALHARSEMVKLAVRTDDLVAGGTWIQFTVGGADDGISSNGIARGDVGAGALSTHRPNSSSIAVLRQHVEAIGGKLIVAGKSDEQMQLSLILPFSETIDLSRGGFSTAVAP